MIIYVCEDCGIKFKKRKKCSQCKQPLVFFESDEFINKSGSWFISKDPCFIN